MKEKDLEVKEVKEEVEEKGDMVVASFGSLANASKTRKKTYTTIDLSDVKTLYNLDNKDCDYKINDCVGQDIRVVDVVVKEFERDLEEPILDKEKCIDCDNCIIFCPDASVNKQHDIDYDYCKGCGICANECPSDAIEMVKE